MRTSKGFTLRATLSVLVIVSVLLTGIVAGYSGIKANRKSLASSYLESNSQYAKKLASNTNDLLSIMQKNMDVIAKTAGSRYFAQQDLDTVFDRNGEYFNSILYVDSTRTVKAISPMSPRTLGTQLTSEESVRALQAREPLISKPYVATTGKLIVLVSAPVFHEDGTYAGFVGGTIYLQEDNALSRLLNQHFYGNGSYLYVVDHDGHLIFHPDKKRINEVIVHNEVIGNVLGRQTSGSQEVVNSKGERFFAGYAYEPMSGWGVVSQTPTSVLRVPQQNLIDNMLLQALPLFLLILIAAWVVSHRISRPLYQLAKFSEDAILDHSVVPSKLPKANSRIYEVNQLYNRFHTHLDQLNTEIQMDGLTGLANRKTFDYTIHQWMEGGISFSLVLLDVDHFKRVNDNCGHLVGDEVLKYVAAMMKSFSRQQDLCFRYGGEEFGILVKFGGSDNAAQIAERLRAKLEQSISPTGGVITVSIGISTYNGGYEMPADIIEMADGALYQSKTEGRNRLSITYAQHR